MWCPHDGTIHRTVPSCEHFMSGSGSGSGVVYGILNVFNISDTTPDPTPDRTSCELNNGPSAGRSGKLCKFHRSLKELTFIGTYNHA